MDIYLKNKVLFITTFIMIVINVAGIVTFWVFFLDKDNKPMRLDEKPGQEKAHIEALNQMFLKELDLDSNQRILFSTSINREFQNRESLQRAIRSEREKIYDVLAGENYDSSLVYNSIDKFLDYTRIIEKGKYNHLKDLKSYLNDKQKIKFNSMLRDLLRPLPPPGAPPRRRE